MKPLKHKFLLTTVLFAFLLNTGCINEVNTLKGDGNLTTMNHDIGYFNKLDLRGMFNVILKEGKEESLVIETDDNLHQHINIEIKNNVLHINSDRDIMLRPSKMDIRITYTDLENLSSGGACNLTGKTTIRAESFTLDISGAAAGELNFETENLETNVSGASSITLTGYANSHKVTLSGASKLMAKNLNTEKTLINLSGAGAANIYATQLLDASLSGVGSIKYEGNPKTRLTNVSGIGSIRSID